MLYLNLRQTKILNYLCHHDDFSSEQLSELLFASARTIQSDIIYINDELKTNGFFVTIKSKRNVGYKLSFQSEDDKKIVTRQCEDYLDSSINLEVGNNPRIPFLIRRLLMHDNYILSEELLDELHLSNSTLTMDLREVRHLIKDYKISIQSLPYYGLKAIGDGISIRNCLIDFCDISNIYEDNPIFYQPSLEQYNIKQEDIAFTRRKLALLLHDSKVLLNQNGFSRLVKYLLLMQGGFSGYDNSMLDIEFQNTPAHLFAKRIITEFALSEKEESYLTLFVLSNLDWMNEISRSTYKDLFSLNENHYNNLAKILNEKFGINMADHPTVFLPIHAFLLKTYVRNKFGFVQRHYSINQEKIANRVPATKHFAITLLDSFSSIIGYKYEKKDVLDLTILLFNKIFVVPNRYKEIRAVVVGEYGRESSAAISYRMDLSKFNIKYKYVSPYELEVFNWDDADCVIVTNRNQINLEKCPVLIFEAEYFDIQYLQRKLWDSLFLKQRKIDYIFPLLENSKIINITTKDNQIQAMVERINENGCSMPVVIDLLNNAIESHPKSLTNHTRVCCIYTKEQVVFPVLKFNLEHALIVSRSRISEIIIMIISLENSVLPIKQADSVAKRIITHKVIVNEKGDSNGK